MLMLNLSALLVFAQDSIPLSEVMVTATRIPIENYKTGRSVEVITSADLQEMPVSSVDEALRYITGMNLNTRNGFGVQTDIGIRGSTFSQVLVLVDNVRFNDPLTAHFNQNIPVALSEIDRIEVVKGPAAASYGSDAVGGLIHIKTKTYQDKKRKNALRVSGDLALGQHNLHSSDMSVILNKDRWLFSTSYKSNISDGEELVNPNFLAGIAPDSLFRNYFDIRTYSASLGYLLNDNMKIYARAGYDNRDFAAKYFYTRSAYDESTEQTKNRWIQTAFNYNKNNHALELNAGYKVGDDFFEFNPLFTPNEHQTRQTFLNFSHQITLKPSSNIAYGAQLLNKDIISTDRGDHNNSSYGVYGILAQDISENLHANVSMRLEYDENFGAEFLPQASLSYRNGNYILRTSYGRAVRAADFTERFVSYQIPSLSAGRNAGNPDLLAEKSNSFDLGADVFLPQAFTLSATAFYRTSKDLIDFSLRNSTEIDNLTNLQDSTDYFYADNISNSRVAGIEFSANKSFDISEKSKVDIKLGYTYLNSAAETGELSKYISNHPKHNVSAIIGLRFDKFSLQSYSTFITRQEEAVEAINGEIMKQYFVSNLKLSYDLLDNVSIYGQALNLTDVNYQEIIGAKPPGRWLSFGVNWNLQR